MNLETQDNAHLTHGQELVEEFLQHFDADQDYRALACHAALPLALTPELLKFLRHEFLPHLSWVAEVDLLLSRLCAEAAEDLYVMRRDARAYLIGQMRQDLSLGETRIEAVNRLLIDRLEYLARNHPALLSQEWETQRLSAMLYVTDQRDRAARELSKAIYQCLTGAEAGKMVNAPNLKTELARLTRLVREAADSMKEKEYEELVKLARLTGKVLSDRSGHYVQQLRSTGEEAQTFRLPGIAVQFSAELLLERIIAPNDKQKTFMAELQETGRKTEDETPSTTLEPEQFQVPPDDLATLDDQSLFFQYHQIHRRLIIQVLRIFELQQKIDALASASGSEWERLNRELVAATRDRIQMGRTAERLAVKINERRLKPPVTLEALLIQTIMTEIEQLGDQRHAVVENVTQILNAQPKDDWETQGRAVCRLGAIFAALGDHHSALRYYEFARGKGDKPAPEIELDATMGLAASYAALGDAANANQWLQNAGKLVKTLGDQARLFQIKMALGDIRSDDLIGAVLVEGYKITKLIWKGHLGTDVYLAEDSSDPANQVTVKVLNHLDLNEQLGRWAERQFEEERRALSLRLDHPGLVKLRGQGRAPNGLRYLILEDGPQNMLRAEMSQVQAVPLTTIASIILQVAEALEYLHSNHVIYRNLKPDNIAMIHDSAGEVLFKLMDFGLAVLLDSTGKRLKQIEASVGSIGALRYMAPEQIVDEASIPSDIYALGVLAYELVTGQLPFQANLLPQQYELQKEGVRVKPREMRPNLPTAAEKAILKCLAFKESARFKRAHDFGVAFAQDILYFNFETVILYAQGRVKDRRALQANQFLEELTSGVTLSMVEIPGGEFLMGSPEDEARRLNAEEPQHRVVISPFFMGKFVITQAQWRVVAGWPKIERELKPEPSYFPRNKRRRPADDERPVDQVSWEDALEFCARLSQKTGRSYRLPTEAELEYACRAGTKTPFAFGETVTPEFANYGSYLHRQEPKGKYRKETVPAGSLGVANAFGLFDMHGNVWEWCQDVWHENYQGAPTDGSAWLDGRHSLRVLRGGAWSRNAYNCRSAYRISSRPDVRDIPFGFRVVVAARSTSGATL
jgi:formylglycine-generating enzyme required for sulfatase activity